MKQKYIYIYLMKNGILDSSNAIAQLFLLYKWKQPIYLNILYSYIIYHYYFKRGREEIYLLFGNGGKFLGKL